MYKIRYLPLAEEDILSAVAYIADKLKNPKAASDLLDELDKIAGNIVEFPFAGGLYRTDRPLHDEIRMAQVKNYVLYYTVIGDTVEVRRFVHSRRNSRQLELE